MNALEISVVEKQFFILASHLSELDDKMKNRTNICFKYFDSSIKNGLPEFSYRLKDGISDQRLGWAILNQNDVPQLLTERLSE